MNKGQKVKFDFHLSRLIGGAHRSGTGVVLFDTIVGTHDARCVQVIDSPDYKAGETIDVYTRNLKAI